MLRHLVSRMRATGPLTVADYMREVLTNPRWGYYMNCDVFGAKGDFITSPEISQVFGEILAAWGINQWQKTKQPTPLHLIELGPGRGTLMSDILHTCKQFHDVHGHLRVHLVEVSPHMRRLQYEKLCGKTSEMQKETEKKLYGAEDRTIPDDEVFHSRHGFSVSWHSHITNIPTGWSLIFAHEFLDALPVHQFKKTKNGWREVLVDLDPKSEKDTLRFVLAPNVTPAVAYLQGQNLPADTEEVEVCPAAGIIVSDIAERLKQHGGAGLIVDYGSGSGCQKHSLRAFRNHKLHDVLSEPGTADITADVNFEYLTRTVADRVSCYGPIPQGYFLTALGISYRVKALLRKVTEHQAKDLMSGWEMMCHPKKMGHRFQVLTLAPHSDPPPAPFEKKPNDNKQTSENSPAVEKKPSSTQETETH